MTRLVRSEAELGAALADTFGFAAFRPGQAEIVKRALYGRDTLAVMPSGAGKSVTYQLPATLLDGCVVVISPLIALMKDQVESLPPRLASVATFLNSSLTGDERRRRIDGIAGGQYRLVYLAPERLRSRLTVEALRQAGVGLFVVDEAHCVVLWGQDFRPDYLFVARVLPMLSHPPVLALTATASPRMVDEIRRGLGRPLELFWAGVARPDTRFEVLPLPSPRAKPGRLIELCARLRGAGIVYVMSQHRAEQLASMLRSGGETVGHYHAGMARDERERAQDNFMAGRTRIVVATSAFGLGVDKRDVRFVLHGDPPASLESYVQEAGRAGRDGAGALCVLLASPADRTSLIRWRQATSPSRQVAEAVWRAIETRAVERFARVDMDDLLRDVLDTIAPEEDRIDELPDEDGDRIDELPDEHEDPIEPPSVDETQLRVVVSLLEQAGALIRHFDMPRMASLQAVTGPGADAEWERFLSRARLRVGQRIGIDLLELAKRLDTSAALVEESLLVWRRRGLLRYRGSGRDMLVELVDGPDGWRDGLDQILVEFEAMRLRRINDLWGYAQSVGCRVQYIARHFGAALDRPCGVCDRCRPN